MELSTSWMCNTVLKITQETARLKDSLCATSSAAWRGEAAREAAVGLEISFKTLEKVRQIADNCACVLG